MYRVIRSVLRGLLITIVSTLLALMTTQIVMRYGFNLSLLWAEEICRYLLIWLVFLGVVLSFERGEVAALTFVTSSLSRRPALILTIFTTALSLAFCLLMVWYGWRFADLAGGSRIPAMRFILGDIFGSNAPQAPTIFWVYIALPFGMALVVLRLAVDITLCTRALASGETLGQALERRVGAAPQ